MHPLSPTDILTRITAASANDAEELSIIRLSEPIAPSAAPSSQSPSKRRSDASTDADAFDNLTPATLEADLTHYQELFAKLRFSYIEQVTKEKFLRAIVGDPPLVVSHADNVALEARLTTAKAELQRRKADVRALVDNIDAAARKLAARYHVVQLQTSQLSTLPTQIAHLEDTIAQLRSRSAAADSDDDNAEDQTRPTLTPAVRALALPELQALLAEREAEASSVGRHLSSTQAAAQRRGREAEAMERELAGLERRRAETTAAMEQTLRRKRDGESDGLEQMGKWYRGVDKGLKDMVL